ncbi:MAG: GNAT family N-acetyltransferase [Muribaculaceae bacterium]|nr:GNAT family N-acetyltransferase [Muribaculaceae bacterium]
MDIKLVPLTTDDREQFILDNQQAFKYGAQEEFGMRDDRMEEGEEVISRKTIERCLDDNQAEAYRIMHNEDVVGGMILKIDRQNAKGELEILFIKPDAHSKGLGQAAWKAVEIFHPEISVWETMTPYFEKRNIHFYVNRLGFHIVELWNKYQRGPAVPEDIDENWSDDDEMFLFRKIMTKQ